MRTHSTNEPGIPGSENCDLIDKSEAARRLDLSKRTLDEWMRNGRIPYLKIGRTVRFRWESVIARLEERFRVN